MIKKTKEYDIFKFRQDNRAEINQSHVKRLIESIKSRNLLELRPISVNKKMEVIDGQHRLLAAKALKVDIYYEMNETLKAEDIIIMNISRPWGIADYLNYYCKNGVEEYLKLSEFMKKNNIKLKVALGITMGLARSGYADYKAGKYKFSEDELGDAVDICWDTIGYIKKMNGYSQYTNSTRFWQALLKLVRHHEFNEEKWRSNLEKMIERFNVKATTDDYLRMFMDVYNWKNPNRLNLLEESF